MSVLDFIDRYCGEIIARAMFEEILVRDNGMVIAWIEIDNIEIWPYFDSMKLIERYKT